MTLLLYDDAQARSWEPFALTRPASTLVAGARCIADRWRMVLGDVATSDDDVAVLTGPHLTDFDEGGAPRAHRGMIEAGTVVAHARFAPSLVPVWQKTTVRDTEVWRHEGRVAAVRLTSATDPEAFAGGFAPLETFGSAGASSRAAIDGWWLEDVWDLVRLLPEVVSRDIDALIGGREAAGTPPRHSVVIGDGRVHVARGDAKRGHEPATHGPAVEPHVVFDATGGPILVEAGAHVRAFTRLVGPCYVGAGSTILGGDVGGSSIGPMCKVRGDVSTTVFAGLANKAHDGFVGHSYVGKWVNLGAGTITSNLKNTYGPVSMWTPAGVRDTGMQFLGTMFGDHAKTGIGARLTTGTVLGAGANVYGSAIPPRVVPPFAWGEHAPYRTYRLEKFLEVAERVMARRNVTLTESERRQLAAAHAARWLIEDNGE